MAGPFIHPWTRTVHTFCCITARLLLCDLHHARQLLKCWRFSMLRLGRSCVVPLRWLESLDTRMPLFYHQWCFLWQLPKLLHALNMLSTCSQHAISIPKQFEGGDVLHLGTCFRGKEICDWVCSACSNAEELDVFFCLSLNMGEPLFICTNCSMVLVDFSSCPFNLLDTVHVSCIRIDAPAVDMISQQSLAIQRQGLFCMFRATLWSLGHPPCRSANIIQDRMAHDV